MKIAPILLAAFLQVGPMCRAALGGRLDGRPRVAVICAWLAGAVVLLGSFDAVSGASASISGMVKYVGTTPVGAPTNSAVEPVNQPFNYRITVSNPGTDVANNYFNCIPLPPGLTINTNLGGAGYITGTPTNVGSYAVTLVAGNANYPTPATLSASIVIYRPNAPPVITNQPQSLSTLVGSNVTFKVAADGTPPLSYQWLLNGAVLSGKTAPLLTLTNVAARDAGNYQATVTNVYGSATSTVARLTLSEPFLVQLRLGGLTMSNNALHFQVTGPIYTNYVVWRSADLTNWFSVQTNWVVDGVLTVTDTNAPRRRIQFYRASVAP
jgi:uncharacterized repeat protein (TIGR01451 family)